MICQNCPHANVSMYILYTLYTNTVTTINYAQYEVRNCLLSDIFGKCMYMYWCMEAYQFKINLYIWSTLRTFW